MAVTRPHYTIDQLVLRRSCLGCSRWHSNSGSITNANDFKHLNRDLCSRAGDNTYNQQNHPSPTTTPPQSQNSPLLLPGGEQFIPNKELMGSPCQNVGTYKDGPAKIRRLPIDGESYELAYILNLSFDAIHPVPAISNRANCTFDYHPEQKIQHYFLQDRWFNNPSCFFSIPNIMNLDS
jgi:hypothetical protein